MNLMDYVRIILRRWWIIALLVVLSAGGAFLFSRAQTPVYRATQTILMKPSRVDFGLSQATTILVRSYVVYLSSTDRAQKVIDDLQLDMVPDALLGSATIDADQTRLALTVDVDLPDGDLANRIARHWGELFVDWRNEENQRSRYEDRIDAELIDYPRYTQIRPNTTINVAAGVVLGLLLGGVIVFVLEYLESNVIRQREDVTRSLNLPVLGSIPPEDARS